MEPAVAETKTSTSTAEPVKKHKKLDVKYPDYLGSTFASILVFIMAATMNGNCFKFDSLCRKNMHS